MTRLFGKEPDHADIFVNLNWHDSGQVYHWPLWAFLRTLLLSWDWSVYLSKHTTNV